MGTVCVIEAEDAAFVYSGHRRQEKGEIVSNNFTLLVDPDLLPEDADSTGTPKTRFIIGVFAQVSLSAHIDSVKQLMQPMQHLRYLAWKQKKPKTLLVPVL